MIANDIYVFRNIVFFKKIASMRVESDMSDDEDEVMIQDSGPVASPTNVTTDVESRYPIRNRRPTRRYGQNIYEL